MRDDEYRKAAELGLANKRAEQLLANHCRHARVHLLFGTSELGRRLGLPIGQAQVRCQHVDEPRHSSMHVTDLAVAFYENNCVGCEHRAPNGLVPTIATAVADRAAARVEAEARAAAARVRAVEEWETRRAARRVAVASEGYPARDVADGLDLLDPHPEGDSSGRVEAKRVRRLLVETARRAPEVFTSHLVDTIVDFGLKRRDGTACTVLRLLARSGVVTPERAANLAAQVLAEATVPEAGQVVAELAAAADRDLLRLALPNIIALSAERDALLGRTRPAEPAALLAAAALDTVLVTGEVIAELAADDDARRADAAYAAMVLLQADVRHLAVLGRPLVMSIRGADQIYAGEPKPSNNAARALAEAWRGEPAGTAALVENSAAEVDDETRSALYKVIFFLHRWRDDSPVPDEAVRVATAFLLRRIGGDWGSKISHGAARDLVDFAKRYPHVVLDKVEALLAALLALSTGTSRSSSLIVPDAPVPDPMYQELTVMDEMLERQRRSGKIRCVAEALGHLAKSVPSRVIPSVTSLLSATTGDDEVDSRTRASLLQVLAQSVTAANVAGMLPVLYTHLLSTDQVVRSASIDLWKGCAQSAEELPVELAELAPALAVDEYVVVHKKMLRALPALGLGDKIAAGLVDHFAAWAHVYAESDPQALEDALYGVLWAAHRRHDEGFLRGAALWVAERSAGLYCSDRERLLLDFSLRGVRSTEVWAKAALETMADPERPSVNIREDPLLAAMLDEPRGLVSLPIEMFGSLAQDLLPRFVGLAVEPLELLQAAGRFPEAAVLAAKLVDLVPDTREFRAIRWYLSAVESASRAEVEAHDGVRHVATTEVDHENEIDDEDKPPFVVHARHRARVRDCLADVPVADPSSAATVIEDAVALIKGANVSRAVQHYGSALALGAKLLRYDAALRCADGSDVTWLASVKREAAVFLKTIDEEKSSFTTVAAKKFAVAVGGAEPDTVDQLLNDLRRISAPLPLAQPVTYRMFRTESFAAQNVSARQQSEQDELPPLVVAVLSLDDHPVVDAAVLRTDYVYDLGMDLRLEKWPDWADECHVSLLTVLPPDVLTAPTFTFTRADIDRDQQGVLIQAKGTLRCAAERQVGQPPLDLPVHIQFVAGVSGTSGPARLEVAEVGGHRRLRLRPYDPTRDIVTPEQLSPRLLEFYEPLHDDHSLDQDDVHAFCRLFTACVRAAHSIMFNRVFRAGQRVTEQQFHDDLEQRLLGDPTLGGRVARRDPLAGGFDDLRHDNIVAELKVEKVTPRTVETCTKFLGQPTQYGVGQGSRLSMLVVLDHARKTAPPAVLENYIGWLLPAHHGLADPSHPSRVRVLIIPTGWPVPSAWSRRRAAVRGDGTTGGV
ncbi:hypothetical protein [Lentzea cavernae]|nr:hypothetical protein [Lentzea cavernae]